MNFERGRDPKEALDLGWKKLFKTMEPHGWVLLSENDVYQNIGHRYSSIEKITIYNIRGGQQPMYNATLVVLIFKNEFKILKNRYTFHPVKGDIKDLPGIILEMKEAYDIMQNHRRNFNIKIPM